VLEAIFPVVGEDRIQGFYAAAEGKILRCTKAGLKRDEDKSNDDKIWYS
jgi:hypothetical protein